MEAAIPGGVRRTDSEEMPTWQAGLACSIPRRQAPAHDASREPLPRVIRGGLPLSRASLSGSRLWALMPSGEVRKERGGI